MSLASILASLELGLTETKLILSSLGILYISSHSALRRPHSASPKKIHKNSDGKKERELEKEGAPEGLSPKDALLFPVMAAVVLVGLYYLIQYLQDPDILNKILRGYLSLMAVGGLTAFYSDIVAFVASFVFPSHWRGKDGDTHRVYTVCSRSREHVSVDRDGTRHTRQMPYGPLPVSWLPMPSSDRVSAMLWGLYQLTREEFKWRLKIYPLMDVSFMMSMHGPLGFVLALGTVILYYLTESLVIGNIMGVAFCYSSGSLISPTSFPTGALILIGLFFYDIVMVFFTPYMITVATKLDAPIKLVYSSGSKVNMLGLGDIVVPGMVISLALRFDLWRHYQKQIQYIPVMLESEFNDTVSGKVTTSSSKQYIAKKKEFHGLSGAWADRFWLRGEPRIVDSRQFSKTYFHASLIGYTIGMLVTVFFLLFFKRGQPALLYLVPGVLGSLLATGWVRGELKEMWDYTEDGSLDTEDTIVQLDAEGKVITEPKANKSDVDSGDEKTGEEKPKNEEKVDNVDGQKGPSTLQKDSKGKKTDGNHHIFIFSISMTLPKENDVDGFEFENLHSE